MQRWFRMDAHTPRLRRRFTVEGIWFIVLMLVLGFAAWHSGTNLIYLLFSLMIGFLLVHGFVCPRAVSKLHISRRLPAEAVAGRPFSVDLQVRNARRRIARGLRLSDHLDNGEVAGAAFLPLLRPGTPADTSYVTRFVRRGLYRFARLEAATRYPFGFMEYHMSAETPEELIVYPELVAATGIDLFVTTPLGELESRSKGVGTDIYGLRSYQQGDHARRIHWRSTARTGALMVMEFEKDVRHRVFLMLRNALRDHDEPDDQLREAFEKAVIVTASIANRLVQEGYEVGLETDSGHVPLGNGAGHLKRLLRCLALINLDPACSRIAFADELGALRCEIRYSNGEAVAERSESISAAIDIRDYDITGGRLVRREAR